MTEQQLDEEYSKVKPIRSMDDKEYDAINKRAGPGDTPNRVEVMSELSSDERRRYFETGKWHYQQRSTMTSIEGIMVGDKTIDEYLADMKKH